MPKIFNSAVPYSQLPCERCGSKRVVSKTWVEKVETAGGISLITHSQFICTNVPCQAKFEKLAREETRKREKNKVEKEKAALARKKANVITARIKRPSQ